MIWYEELGFKANPYEGTKNPYEIPLEMLAWNRPDLEREKKKLDDFVEDICEGRKVGLRMFGPNRSGKTWLTRLLEKEILYRRKIDALFLYTKVEEFAPAFGLVYQMAIEGTLVRFEKIAKYLKESKGDTSLKQWMDAFPESEDLAHCFSCISQKSNEAIAKSWLLGDKVSAANLGKLEIVHQLDSDFKKFEALRHLFKLLSEAFQTVILVVDQLERASKVKEASVLSDILREMLDVFPDRFVLVLSFMGEKEEAWFSLGYSLALEGRLRYVIQLSPIDPNTVCDLMRTHHSLYRKQKDEKQDELRPFKESGIKKLLQIMRVQYHYPGYLLTNCEELAREALKTKKNIITESFVVSHKDSLRFK